ncbi:MAG: hypothetical protein PHG79_03350 [Methanosarcina sp.]|nr:hypothetical protein [Methanosarcina sp.]
MYPVPDNTLNLPVFVIIQEISIKPVNTNYRIEISNCLFIQKIISNAFKIAPPNGAEYEIRSLELN